MLVQQILNAKPESEIVTVPPGSSIADAVALLAARRIGAVVVSADGQRIAGILSERDIVRGLGQHGAAVLTQPVETLMTAKIVTCERGDSARQVVERMTAGRFRHMPVVEDGLMIGVISIGDVVKGRLDELVMEKRALEGMIQGF